jgi:DNA (cytosine-5)-methyltransferase 1
MSRPVLLDLFCCEGGAAVGYHRAGFDVIGVDKRADVLANYPFPCVQADALNPPFDLGQFDAIHASPPCQAYSTITRDKSVHEDLIPPTRDLLAAAGVPYVIENVEGARRSLVNPAKVCGSFFMLDVRRHRYFETNWPLRPTTCLHGFQGRPVGVYGDHPQDDSHYRRPDGTLRGNKAIDDDHAREVMGMPWATWHGCTQAIPPAYTEFIGRQLLDHIEGRVAA